MAPQTVNAIRVAVRYCIVKCRDSLAPMTCLQDFLDELQRKGWDRDALSQVKTGVLNVILDAVSLDDPETLTPS